MSKSVVRQRIISSHGHLAGKLRTGVLTGHSQVLSSYPYDTGAPLANLDSQDALSSPFPPSRDPGVVYHCFKHRDNSRHLELGCKQPYLESSSLISEERFFRSAPSYESPLLSRPYCADAIASREACMYGGVEAPSGSGSADRDERSGSPAVNCNMWAPMQPYSRYSVDGIPYQPFPPHFPNPAPVLPQPASSLLPRPQADFGVYNSAMVQRSLPAVAQSSSSSSGSAALTGSRDTTSHPPLYHKKPGSALQPLKEFSACSIQGMIPGRDPSYQHQMGLSGAGSHWSDG